MQITLNCSAVTKITIETIVTERRWPGRQKNPGSEAGVQVQAAFAGDGGKYCLGMEVEIVTGARNFKLL